MCSTGSKVVLKMLSMHAIPVSFAYSSILVERTILLVTKYALFLVEDFSKEYLGYCFRIFFLIYNRFIFASFLFFSCSEYYFSTENLERDFFLRRKMDQQGFLPVSLIASFHRVQALTTNAMLILEVK